MKNIQKPKEFNLKSKEQDIYQALENLRNNAAQNRTWLENYVEREMRTQRYQYNGIYSIDDFREHEEYIRKEQMCRLIQDIPLNVLNQIFDIEITTDGIFSPEGIRVTTRINI